MKKGPFKMKGPGIKAGKKYAKAKNVRNIYSAAGKVDMTLNDKLNQAVRKKSASFATPKIEAQKATGRISKKPTSLATRAFRGFKNVAKGLGRRALGGPIVGAAAAIAPHIVKGSKAVMPGLKRRAKQEFKNKRSIYSSPKI